MIFHKHTDVEQLLVPNVAPDKIVVLDNPGADEGRRARRAGCAPRI